MSVQEKHPHIDNATGAQLAELLADKAPAMGELYLETHRLLLELGWPGSMGLMAANLRRLDIPLGEIRYALAPHYHIDHAGPGQELKQTGAPLLVMDWQLSAIPLMKRWTKPEDNYLENTTDDNVVISCAESRALGIAHTNCPPPRRPRGKPAPPQRPAPHDHEVGSVAG
jgi:metal-dependent hydrolase (beta-lactamase superfamily II)